LEEFLEAQKLRRPENDELQPRAPRVDGDFRAVKEFVKVDQKLYPVEKKEEKEEVKKPQKKRSSEKECEERRKERDRSSSPKESQSS